MINLLYCDDSMVACVKPVGFSSEGEGINALPAVLEAQLGGGVFPMHRLDQNVGGVILFARTHAAAAVMSNAITQEKLEKRYLAVIRGILPDTTGSFRDLLFKDSTKNKVYVVDRMRKGVREACLSYRVIASGTDEMQPLSLVEITLETGRSHQIRVQFASRGFPLLGDGKYGGGDNRCTIALWSTQIVFPHPKTKESITVHQQPPLAFPWSLFDLTEKGDCGIFAPSSQH